MLKKASEIVKTAQINYDRRIEVQKQSITSQITSAAENGQFKVKINTTAFCEDINEDWSVEFGDIICDWLHQNEYDTVMDNEGSYLTVSWFV